MQEFESISASSYDPSALATKLTAKAAEGWSVVAIVPTGGDVTAFLSRDSSAGSASVLSGGAADMSGADTSTSTETSDRDFASTASTAAAAEPIVEPMVEPAPEPEEPEAVAEPAGWAIAPEPVGSGTSSGTTDYAASTSTEPSSSYQPTSQYQPTIGGVGASSSSSGSSSGSSAPATPAPSAPEPAPAPAVPAGWYADPAGRFELRYWDGSTWTEHVSRAGQQFTDPPVA